ncbi:MAG: MBL fold metallo-hydrolase [Rhodospirillaceae bacterium]|nr:MBL fold metallo-hydrolase [Rhodospirillaceae bacterium]MBT6088433.1 MBL fold metallo-hydrolase [Rhodospirillaceae bacterium]MBT7449533.1 MBL fold metallo-hydrolase [Rhodospirillaceae bacterium]
MPTPARPNETPLDFPWSDAPESETCIEVAPGVNWIRMPLPFALDHINLWVLEETDGWVLVDSGFDSSITQEIWARLFKTVFAGKPPKRLICTHHHPDHMGLAGWLTETYDIPLSTTQKEWDAYHLWSRLEPEAVVEMMGHFYKRGGVSGDRGEIDLRRRKSMSSRDRADPIAFARIEEADEIKIDGRPWTVNIGTGHAPELAALFRADDKVLISGDQVLPRISPNVSVMPFALDADPLKDFLDSLDRFRTLPVDTLVLPSHKLPFYGLHDRIDALKSHHMDRLDDAFTACVDPTTAADATTVLFPRALDDHQYFFALGETLAHLNYLWCDEQVSREETASGTFVFQRR